jgi:hypothetical protein
MAESIAAYKNPIGEPTICGALIILWLHRYKSNPVDLKLTLFQIGFAVPENCYRTLTF